MCEKGDSLITFQLTDSRGEETVVVERDPGLYGIESFAKRKEQSCVQDECGQLKPWLDSPDLADVYFLEKW